jgi:hypothetical protein
MKEAGGGAPKTSGGTSEEAGGATEAGGGPADCKKGWSSNGSTDDKDPSETGCTANRRRLEGRSGRSVPSQTSPRGSAMGIEATPEYKVLVG